MPQCQDTSCLPGLCYYVHILLCVSAVGPWISRTSPGLQITGIMKSIAFYLSFKEARSLHPQEMEVLLITWMLEKPAALSWSLVSAEMETWDHINRSTKVATVLPHKTGGELGVCLTWDIREDTRVSSCSGDHIWAEEEKSSWNWRFPVTQRQLAHQPLDGWDCQRVLFAWHVMSGAIVPMSGGSPVNTCEPYRLWAPLKVLH